MQLPCGSLPPTSPKFVNPGVRQDSFGKSCLVSPPAVDVHPCTRLPHWLPPELCYLVAVIFFLLNVNVPIDLGSGNPGFYPNFSPNP